MTNDILFLDIETSPLISYTWGIWEQNVIEVKKEWYVMSFSAKVGGEHITKGLSDYRGYKMNSDKALVTEIWHLLDRSSVVVAHNGDQFDLKKIYARFAFWNQPPPSPYQTVDTLKVARRYFAFTSNKLDDLGQYLGLGRKMKHEGFDLWKRCMAWDLKAWRKMKAYNRQDIILLEKVYFHLLPFIKTHPNMGMFHPGPGTVCPRCGSGKGFKPHGTYTNQAAQYKVWRCKNCRAQSRTTMNIRDPKPALRGL